MQTPPERKMHRTSARLRLFAASFVILTFAAVLGAAAFFKFYEPDPNENTYDPFGNLGPEESMPGVILPNYDDGVSDSSNSFFDGLTQPKGRYNFLVVGLDKVSRSPDIMMIVSYDVKSGQINIVQIPRDTYLKVDGIRGAYRINSYYSVYYNYANRNGHDDPETRALTNLAALIQKSFAIRLNYCAVVDLEGFVNIIDAVGGVDMDIPEDMFYEDPYQDLYIDLKAGYQHLDGNRAMQFVRYRKGYAEQDIGRQNALKNFMSALLAQLKANMNVGTMVNISGEVMSNMRSNISTASFLYFAKSALSVDLSRVYMTTLPGRATMVDGASVYVLYRDDTVAMINKYLNVFDRELTREHFDPGSYMVGPGVEEIYESPLGTMSGDEYNAEDLNENPIDIPRR